MIRVVGEEGYILMTKVHILEIDDETDEDIMSVLLEEQLPEGIGLQLANA